MHLKEAKDLVATPLLHDSPGEIAQAEVNDWRKGECEPVPGKTMPQPLVVFRDYANAYNMMTALGPLAAKPGVGSKGVMWSAEEEYAELKEKLGTVTAPGMSQGMPSLATGQQVAETILHAGARNQRRDRHEVLGAAREEDRAFPYPPE